MEDLTGKKLGAYQIVSPLGEGGMGSVYKAYQFSVDRYVAIKVLPRHFAEDPQFVTRFEQEAKVLAKLQHPHILPIHDYGYKDGYTYMIMPLVPGGDLADLFNTRRLSLDEINRIMAQVGDALDYAHTQGVVHRDVKPNNILLDARGNCLLSDFGLAKLVERNSKLTGTDMVVGTPHYMSPEQGMSKNLDGRSDVYSLGVVLYELVTGKLPFQAETPMAVMFQHIQAPLPPPSEIDPTISKAIERVIVKSLAKQPDDRYSTPGDLAQALQTAIQTPAPISLPQAEDVPAKKYPRIADKTKPDSGGGMTKVLPTTPAPAPKISPPASPDQTLLWALVSLALLLVIGLAGLGVWWFSRSSKAEATPPTPVIQPSVTRVQLELPQATPTPIPQPTSTALPTAQPQPAQAPAAPAQPVQPSSQQPPAPPPEAIEACRQSREGDVCTANLPGGSISGTCLPVVGQLACIPEGAPRPPGP